MTVPASYAVRIYINDTDVTDNCPYESLSFSDYAHDVSTFNFTYENAAFTPVEDDVVLVFCVETTPVRLIFNGYVVNPKERKHDNAIVKDYEIEAADRKIRLQKSLLAPKDYTGLDGDILADLLGDAYPDLSLEFDFSSLVNDVNSTDFGVNDDNLLDMLDKLADQTGAKYRFDKDAGGGEALITFDADTWGTSLTIVQYAAGSIGWYIYGAPLIIQGVEAVGNPDSCARWRDHPTLNSFTNGNTIGQVEVNLGGVFEVTTIEFDYYVSGTSNVRLFEAATAQTQAIAGTGAWHSHTFTLNANTSNPKIGFEATATLNTSVINFDLRIDNIRITTTTPIPGGDTPKDVLVWDNEADLTDYDFDIDSSDEYLHDLEFETGGFDDFNSVTVIGGAEDIAIEWTYHGDSYSNHLKLELPVKDIAVFRNTGSDATPSWTALSLGYWGVDELIEDSGSKEVLYDKEYHWLLFDSSDIPGDLKRAVKVTGSIRKPMRVRVEDVGSSGVIKAMPLYNDTVKTPEEAATIGFAELAKRNRIRKISFSTYNPGLKVGQKITVTDTNRGLNETVEIQHIQTKWIGASGHAEFEVEAGNDTENGADVLIANNDKRSREKAPAVPVATQTATMLVDEAGIPLVDEAGNQLYVFGE